MAGKIIPFRDSEITRNKLVKAVGKVIAKHGFMKLGVNLAAREAGVNKGLIYRYFGGLEGLIHEYSKTVDFWPDVLELVKGDAEALRAMPPGRLMAVFFKRYLRAIMSRPITLEILAWEGLEKNHLTDQLEETRIRTALEFFEYLEKDPPEDVDLSALVALMAGAVNFVAVRSRRHRFFGGVDLDSEQGLERLEATMERMLAATLDGPLDESPGAQKNGRGCADSAPGGVSDGCPGGRSPGRDKGRDGNRETGE